MPREPFEIELTEIPSAAAVPAAGTEDDDYDNCDLPLHSDHSDHSDAPSIENGGNALNNAAHPPSTTADGSYLAPLVNSASSAYGIWASARRDLVNGNESLGPLTSVHLSQSLRGAHPAVAAVVRTGVEGAYWAAAGLYAIFPSSYAYGVPRAPVIPADSAGSTPPAEPVRSSAPPAISTSAAAAAFHAKVEARNKQKKAYKTSLETIEEGSEAEESGESTAQALHRLQDAPWSDAEDDGQDLPEDDAAPAVVLFADPDSDPNSRDIAEDESGSGDSDDSDHSGNAGGPKDPGGGDGDGSDGSAGDGSSGVGSASNPAATPSNSESAPESAERDAQPTAGDGGYKPVVNHALAVEFLLAPMALSNAWPEPADFDEGPDLLEHQEGGAWLEVPKLVLTAMAVGSVGGGVWQGLPSLESLYSSAGLVGVDQPGASAFAA